MPVRLRRLLLMLMLMVMPLQGAASAMHALACTPESGHAAVVSHPHAGHHDHHGHGGHDHGTPHQHSGDDGGTGHAGHPCCHHVSSATAPGLLDIAHADLPVYLSSLTPLETLFFPEQPQRPPRG